MRGCFVAVGLLAAVLCQPALAAEPAAAVSERDLKRGKLLYLQCRACHAVSKDEGEKVGPSLVGIYGRPAAGLATFKGYSEAMRKSGIVWNEATLDRWLRSPASVVPGNLMAYAGMANDADRAVLLRYLRHATAPNPAAR